ncbi:Mut7-C RNAse domain-containing protein [Candidatus Protochlamydia naegleriophila]
MLFVPDDILQRGLTIRYCSHCEKMYWEGSHAKRMMATLEQWKNNNFG